MLNRRHRILTTEDFRHVLRRGKKTSVTGGVVAVLRTSPGQPFRCGFVVSKIAGNAVARNSIKRRLRAACLLLAEQYPGCEVVVRADQRALSVSVDAWHQQLSVALEKLVSS